MISDLDRYDIKAATVSNQQNLSSVPFKEELKIDIKRLELFTGVNTAPSWVFGLARFNQSKLQIATQNKQNKTIFRRIYSDETMSFDVANVYPKQGTVNVVSNTINLSSNSVAEYILTYDTFSKSNVFYLEHTETYSNVSRTCLVHTQNTTYQIASYSQKMYVISKYPIIALFNSFSTGSGSGSVTITSNRLVPFTTEFAFSFLFDFVTNGTQNNDNLILQTGQYVQLSSMIYLIRNFSEFVVLDFSNFKDLFNKFRCFVYINDVEFEVIEQQILTKSPVESTYIDLFPIEFTYRFGTFGIPLSDVYKIYFKFVAKENVTVSVSKLKSKITNIRVR